MNLFECGLLSLLWLLAPFPTRPSKPALQANHKRLMSQDAAAAETEPPLICSALSDAAPANLETVLQFVDDTGGLPPAPALRAADAAELAKMVESPKLHAHLPSLLPSAFGDADAASKGARLDAVAHALVRVLDADVLSDSLAKKVSQWVVETALVAAAPAAAAGGARQPRARAGLPPTSPRALLPVILSHLCAVDDADDLVLGVATAPAAAPSRSATARRSPSTRSIASRRRRGRRRRSCRSRRCCATSRSRARRAPRRDSPASASSSRRRPPRSRPLLLLADTAGKPTVLRALHEHFEGGAARGSPQGLVVQGTVLMHVQFAVKQEQALAPAILEHVKKGLLPLGGFTFALLLSLAQIGERFRDAALQHLVSRFKEAAELRAWTAASPWLAHATASLGRLSPDALLGATIRSSATPSFDHLVPSLLELAARLLDETPAANAAGAAAPAPPRGGRRRRPPPPTPTGARQERRRRAARGQRGPMALLGRTALVELFLHPPAAADRHVVGRLIGRSAAAAHWLGLLDELVVSQPLAVLEHLPKIKQLLEYVMALPLATATAMLRSLLPLQRQRPELRDHLVLLLRKAMFATEEPTRLVAVHGFLLLLHHSAGTGGGGGGAGGGAGGADARRGVPPRARRLHPPLAHAAGADPRRALRGHRARLRGAAPPAADDSRAAPRAARRVHGVRRTRGRRRL